VAYESSKELNIMRRERNRLRGLFLTAALVALPTSWLAAAELHRLTYNHPGLVVRLGVGLWAMPMPVDYDNDGDLDLLVACNDKPYGGVYFFENPGGDPRQPIFKPGVRLGKPHRYMRISYVNGQPRILIPGHELVDFRNRGFDSPTPIYSTSRVHPGSVRINQWSYVDYDGDSQHDLVVGVGDWSGYGWDNAYNAQGEWCNDRLHGYVYWLRNRGTDSKPDYGPPRPVLAGGAKVDVFGSPSPSFADFDGDGDLDLICGEFLDGFTYFENVGSPTQPQYNAGRRLKHRGQPLHMDLEMITPTAIDWDRDGDVDLIVGDEDGSVALVENTGTLEGGLPQFLPPVYFRQEAAELKFGALVTPTACDWDGDGDTDLLCGNTAGYIGWFENLDGNDPPRWSAVRRLRADGEVIRIQAGPNGSIQGPCEAKWGYTTLSVADWDHDELPDLVVNSIWGEVLWYRNIGSRTAPKLAVAQGVDVAWQGQSPKPRWFWWDPAGKQLVTQWRTTPMAVDVTGDGLNDLVMLDHEGYLALYERRKTDGKLELLPPRRRFVDPSGQPMRLNTKTAGGSGRRKIVVTDWDGDGRLDLLANSSSADWWRNEANHGDQVVLRHLGPLSRRNVSGHTTSPTVVDWNQDGKPDLLVGAEDGHLYYLHHADTVSYPNVSKPARKPTATKAAGLLSRAGVVAAELIDKAPPYSGCHASTIAETRGGLTAAWFAGADEGDPDVGIWVSRNNGDGWSVPVEVANGIQYAKEPGRRDDQAAGDTPAEQDSKTRAAGVLRYPCWNPVLYQVPRGPLMLFYKCGPSPREWWGMLTCSHDGGRVWTPPCRLPEGIDGPIKNKPIRLADGTLLCGSSTEFDGWRVHFEKTSDLGKTWTRIGPINDGKEFGAIQPTLLIHPDGRLQTLCRSRQGCITTSESEDGGMTWSPMKATSLPNPNSGTDAVTLADGRHLLVYNHTLRNAGSPRGRALLNVAVSNDGIDWQAALVLENQSGEFSYPAVIQADDGLVHITYTWKRRHIKHVVVDPKRLELRAMPDGRWPL
jgi:predicted neuraminidase